MDFVRRSLQEGIAEIRIERPLVNAIEGRLVDELSASFRQIAEDPGVRASVLTGTGKFFSFGFDIPLFLGWSKAEFSGYLSRFTSLYREVFSHPKPVVAALNNLLRKPVIDDMLARLRGRRTRAPGWSCR